MKFSSFLLRGLVTFVGVNSSFYEFQSNSRSTPGKKLYFQHGRKMSVSHDQSKLKIYRASVKYVILQKESF